LHLRWSPGNTRPVLLGFLGLFWSQIAWVSPTNFFGYDEWTIHYLVSRGITDIPYANRPLELIWELPARWISPHSFVPYLALYAAYSCLVCWCVFRLCRRLVPGHPALAYLAAGFVVVWVPRDLARLSHIERTMYTSFAFGTLAAFVCFVESWLRRSVILLTVSILVAFVTARSYEGTIALLLAWPLFVAWGLNERSRAYWTWAAAWEVFAALSLAFIVQPLIFPLTTRSYQATLGMDLRPGTIADRLWHEYLNHLVPLATTPLTLVRGSAVVVAVLSFGLMGIGAVRTGGEAPEDRRRRAALGAMAAGLALAALGYAVLALSPPQPRSPVAWRMQFLSAPGMALFLAAVACAISDALPLRLRRALLLSLGCWVVAVGTARTVAMQRIWDGISHHDAQVRVLEGLTELAPELKPHTLVVVVDEVRAWRSTWGFRHAVQYLYRDRAMGYVWDSWDFMFPTRWTPAGVACVPWPEVQLAWRSPPTLHRYDELVVVRNEATGAVDILESWPPFLPPLPPGARYDPRSRILAAAALPAERGILSSLDGWRRRR